jgi:hypothetical protein
MELKQGREGHWNGLESFSFLYHLLYSLEGILISGIPVIFGVSLALKAKSEEWETSTKSRVIRITGGGGRNSNIKQ